MNENYKLFSKSMQSTSPVTIDGRRKFIAEISNKKEKDSSEQKKKKNRCWSLKSINLRWAGRISILIDFKGWQPYPESTTLSSPEKLFRKNIWNNVWQRNKKDWNCVDIIYVIRVNTIKYNFQKHCHAFQRKWETQDLLWKSG